VSPAEREAVAAKQDEHVRRVVATWAPPTDEERARLAVLLAPVGDERERAA
jgi:hypothetical protein